MVKGYPGEENRDDSGALNWGEATTKSTIKVRKVEQEEEDR